MATDRAQFAIDIAAQMKDGETTAKQLDDLAAKLMGSGAQAEDFERAMHQVNSSLDAAKVATGEAAEALSQGERSYAQLERGAVKAAQAAEKAALKHGGIVPIELHQEAERAAKALQDEAEKIDQLRAAATGAKATQDRLASTQKNLAAVTGKASKAYAQQAERLSKMQAGLSGIGGPLGTLGNRVLAPVKGFTELGATMGRTRAIAVFAAVGMAAAGAAAIALAAAAVYATVKVTILGIKLADQARSANLAAEAWGAMHPELATTSAAMGGIARDTGVSSSRLRDLTKSLTGAGVAAGDMPDALRAVAIAEAALGQGGGDKFIEQMKDGKKSVQELANEVQGKFGGIVSRQMLGLEAQSARLKSNVSNIFGGLNIEPLLGALSTLVDLFDENTAAGATMKFLFDTIFQPIIDAATKAIPLVEAFFLGILIGALKIYIKLKPTINMLKELLGFDDPATAETFDMVKKAGEVAAVVIGVMAVAFGGLVAIGVILAANLAVIATVVGVTFAAAVALAIGLVAGIGAAIYGAIEGFKALVGAVTEAAPKVWQAIKDGIGAAIDWITGLDMGQIGIDIVTGLANGIAGSAGAIVKAITGAVGGAISAAKNLLGIASPSKVFAGIGEFTGEGYAKGVEDETDRAQTAMAEMVAPPAPPELEPPSFLSGLPAVNDNASSSPLSQVASIADESARERPQPAAQSSSSSASVNLSGATFVFNGVEGAEDAERRFGELLTRTLEGDLTQAGGEVAA